MTIKNTLLAGSVLAGLATPVLGNEKSESIGIAGDCEQVSFVGSITQKQILDILSLIDLGNQNGVLKIPDEINKSGIQAGSYFRDDSSITLSLAGSRGAGSIKCEILKK